MSRDIKFRAWDRTGNCMVDWSCMRQTAFNRDDTQLMYDIFTKRLDVELMQYTGLKDKNGVEIYEGDIIDKKYKVFVYFKDGQFKIKSDAAGFVSRRLIRWLNLREKAGAPSGVIGNIYENPELMGAV